MEASSETKYEVCSRSVVNRWTECMQEVGVVTDENWLEIVGGKQYSSTSGSVGRSKVEIAGGKR